MKNKLYWKYVHKQLLITITSVVGYVLIVGVGFLFWIGS